MILNIKQEWISKQQQVTVYDFTFGFLKDFFLFQFVKLISKNKWSQFMKVVSLTCLDKYFCDKFYFWRSCKPYYLIDATQRFSE